MQRQHQVVRLEQGKEPKVKRVAEQRHKRWLEKFSDRIVEIVRFPDPPKTSDDSSRSG